MTTSPSSLIAAQLASMDPQIHWPWAIAALTGNKPLVQGDPGTGKTAMADAFCQHLNGATNTVDGLANKWTSPDVAINTPDDGNWHFAEFQLSFQQPEDWKGIPFILKSMDGKDQFTSWVTDALLHLIETRKYVVLIDELGSASPAAQAAALGWLCRPHGRSIILAAGNPPENAAAGVPLTAPMVSRFWVGKWNHQFTHLASLHYLTYGTYPPYPWPVLAENWRDMIPVVSADYAAWNAENGFDLDLIQRVPTEFSEQSVPHPTIRGWQNALVTLAGAMTCGASKMTRRGILEGFVGKAAAVSFLDFQAKQDLPDVRKWLRRPYDQDTRDEMRKLSSEPMAKCMANIIGICSKEADHIQNGLYIMDSAWNEGFGEIAQCWFPSLWRLIPNAEDPVDTDFGCIQEMLDNMIAPENAAAN